jgi:hypothetical protein
MFDSLKRAWRGLLGLAILVSAGCRAAPPATTPTILPELVLTAAAATADVLLTAAAQPAATQPAEPTATPIPATPTPEQAETLPTATLEPQAGATPAPAATLPAGTASGDKAEYVSETVPDGSDFDPGETFVKTWSLKNAGTTTWTRDYALAFLSGAQMGGPGAVALTKDVAPGEIVNLSVTLKAPEEAGKQRGYWKMRNASGQLFEIAVWVEIDVKGETQATEPTGSRGGNTVTNVTLFVDQASASGCPHTFNFSAEFTLKKAATVIYRLEAEADATGFQFDLPAEQTADFGAGTYTVPYSLELKNATGAWVQFHVREPENVVSNQVTIELSCP